MSNDYRRVAVFELSSQAVIELFKSGRRCFEVIENSLPDDAKVKAVHYDILRDVWQVGVESESFEPVHIGEMPPSLTASLLRDTLCEQHPDEARKRFESLEPAPYG